MRPYSPARTYFKLALLCQFQRIHSSRGAVYLPTWITGREAQPQPAATENGCPGVHPTEVMGTSPLAAAPPRSPHLLPLLGKWGRKPRASPRIVCCSWIHRSKNWAQRVWVSAPTGTQGCRHGQRRADQSHVSPSPCFWQKGISWGCASRARWRDARLSAGPTPSPGAAEWEVLELRHHGQRLSGICTVRRKTGMRAFEGTWWWLARLLLPGSRTRTIEQSMLQVTGD